MDTMPRSCSDSLKVIANGTNEEVCGYIMKDWSFIKVPNVAEDPKTGFFFHTEISRSLQQEYAGQFLGIYHSHPGGKPSPSIHDLDGWPPSFANLRYFIIAKGGKVIEWEREPDGDAKCLWVSA